MTLRRFVSLLAGGAVAFALAGAALAEVTPTHVHGLAWSADEESGFVAQYP